MAAGGEVMTGPGGFARPLRVVDARPGDLPPAPRRSGCHGGGNWPFISYLEFDALPTAPSCARLHARARLAEWGLAILSSGAELVVSELTTNAVEACGALGADLALIRMWLLSDASRVVIVVWDGNRQPPLLTEAPVTAENGRGLQIVAAVSSGWGWYGRSDMGGKCVWAVFRKPPAELVDQTIAGIGPPAVGKTSLRGTAAGSVTSSGATRSCLTWQAGG
jgi:hypothetical protein